MEHRPIGQAGLSVSAISFGASGIGNLYKAIPPNDAEEVLEAAWAAGIRYFDTAPRYGHGLSERRLGDFLRSKGDEPFVLSTKVGRLLTPLRGRTNSDYGFVDPLPFEQEYDYSYDGIMRSHEHSLHRLGLDRVDILYMHDIGVDTHGPGNAKLQPEAFSGGLRAMQQLKSEGQVKAIGLGVNEVQVCLDALDHAELDCFLLAGRYILLDHAGARPLLDACKKRGANLVVGGVFNSGILATGPIEGAMYDYSPASDDILDRTRRIQAICQEFGITLPAAALHFPLANARVSSVLLGVSGKTNLRRNLDGFEVQIPEGFWRALCESGLMDETEALLRA